MKRIMRIIKSFLLRKPKLGMYGETPRVRIGNFEICEFSLPPNETIWIEVIDGEGAGLSKNKFSPILKQFFNDNF